MKRGLLAQAQPVEVELAMISREVIYKKVRTDNGSYLAVGRAACKFNLTACDGAVLSFEHGFTKFMCLQCGYLRMF